MHGGIRVMPMIRGYVLVRGFKVYNYEMERILMGGMWVCTCNLCVGMYL